MVDLSIASSTGNPVSDSPSDDGESTSSQQIAGDVDGGVKLNTPEIRDQKRYQSDEFRYLDIASSSDSNNIDNKTGLDDAERHKNQPSLEHQANMTSLTSQSNKTSSSSIVTPEEARDEEEDDTLYSGRWTTEDPYVYSDDSASLSDAYFFPQSDDDLARPLRYRSDETDSFTGDGGGTLAHNQSQQQYPLANYYGSITNSPHNSQQSHFPQNHQQSSYPSHPHGFYPTAYSGDQRPQWLTAGSIQAIQEDSEEIIIMNPPNSSSGGHQNPASAVEGSWLLASNNSRVVSNGVLRRERRRQRRLKRGWMQQQQLLQQKQREKQANRERTVNQVRGRPQNDEVRDVFWAFVFLLQILIVCFCAGYFGRSLFAEESSMSWTHYLPSPVAGNNFHHWDGERRQPQRNNRNTLPVTTQKHKSTEAIPVLPVLVHNATTGELQYDESLLKNETANKAANAMKNPPLTTIDVVSSLNAEVTGTDSDDEFDNVKNESFTIDYQNVVALISISGFYACFLSTMSFVLMLILARALIQIMLIFSISLALAWGMIGLTLDPYGVISVLGFTALLLALGYTMYHWQRIPFAATNLYTALCALRSSVDIVLLGLGGILVSFTWSMVWGVAFMGIVNNLHITECDQKNLCQPHFAMEHVPFYLLLLLSYHWTNTVIKNILSVTVASVVGTWWFYPGDIGCFCTLAVSKPLLRALTKSLGSICLGSLAVQPAQVLANMGNCCYSVGPESNCLNAQVGPDASNDDEPKYKSSFVAVVPSLSGEDDEASDLQIGLCRRCCSLHERFHAVLRECNRWSYTYIGMYGYGFADAGALALKLFETREWLEVVKDGLIQNVLIMASVIIGGSTGTFAVVVEESDGYDFSSFHKPVLSAFLIGSVLGYVLSNILLLGVVGSAVNTIFVCFAAGPFEFDKNHKKLSREMREVWSQQVWEPSV